MSRKTNAQLTAELAELKARSETENANLRQDNVALRNEIARLKGVAVAEAHASGLPAPAGQPDAAFVADGLGR